MHLIHCFQKPILLKKNANRESVRSSLSNQLELLNMLKNLSNNEQPIMIRRPENFNSQEIKRLDTYISTESV